MKSLNVGCGNVPLQGWINTDKYYYPGSENPLTDQRTVKSWDQTEDSQWIFGIAEKLNFPNESFDEVMLIHCLEHLSMENGNLAIKEAHRVLKPGGRLDIEVPNLLIAADLIIKTPMTDPKWYRVMGLLHGTTGLDGEGQFHLCGYTPEYLRFKLNERGFKDIQDEHVGFGHGNPEEGHAEEEYDFRLRCIK